MASKSKLNIIMLVIFGLLLVIGFSSFALYGKFKSPSGSVEDGGGTVEIVFWGTLPGQNINKIVRELNRRGVSVYGKLVYVEKNPQTFVQEYIRAIATGTAPSLVILPHTVLLQNQDVIQRIQYTQNFSRASYKDLFVSAGDIFLNDTGMLALPFLADPLVLYYNENIRIKDRIADQRSYTWSMFSEDVELRSAIRRDGTSIQQALVPFGVTNNYDNAVDMFITLLQQAKLENSATPLSSVFSFFEAFSNPRSPLYTWNSSLPKAQDFFLSGQLLFYPGFASEYGILKKKNPNLVFRTAVIPQLNQGDTLPYTITRLYGIALSRSAPAPNVALDAAFDVLRATFTSNTDTVEQLERQRQQIIQLFTIPPAIREFVPPANAPQHWKVFADSAKIGKVWYVDQYDKKRSEIAELIYEVNKGALTPIQAASRI